MRRQDLILILVATISLATGYSNTGERSIRSSVLSSFAYDRMARPSESTKAYVGFNLLAINDLNIASQEFVCSGWLTVLWNDNRLQWLPATYDGTEYIHALESEIWKPEVLVDNAIEDIGLMSDDHLIYRIKYNGDVEWEPPLSVKVYCSIDITYFPFDTQSCTVELVSWGLPKPELVLSKLWSNINFNEFRESGSWEILESSVNESDITVLRRNISVETYSQMEFSFTVKRKPGLYIINTIIPIIVTSYLILIAFLVPAVSGEKLTFAAMVIVMDAVLMTVFLEQLPDISITTSILSQYLASNLCLAGAVIMICALISQIHYQPPESKISILHKIVIFILKKLTLWCDPDPPEDVIGETEDIFVDMRTDDLKKIERSMSTFRRNAVQPAFIDGFTETVQIKDNMLLQIPPEFKEKSEKIVEQNKERASSKIRQKASYDIYNWSVVAKVWDRFFFALGVVAVTLFHLNFVSILRSS